MCLFVLGESQGGKGKSKNDTWGEKELSRHIIKGSLGAKLNKTSPEAFG